MTQSPRQRTPSTAASALALAMVLASPAHGDSLWIVAIVGGAESRVRTHEAASEGDLLVDLQAMSSLLGAIDPQSVSADAVLYEDEGAFASLMTLGRAAGMQVVLSPSERRAYLFPVRRSTQSAASWTPLQVKKTALELEEMHRRDAVPLAAPVMDEMRPVLPGAHSSLLVRAGIGYVAGADAAAILDVSGSSHGYRIGGSAFLTRGSEGLRYVSGRASVESAGGLWQIEAGDLFGELRGLTRGSRFTLMPGRRWSPSFAAYTVPGGAGRVTLAYRDRFAWTEHLESTTEVTSDGSAFARASFVAGRAYAEVFYRRDQWRGVQDRGVSGSLNVWRGFTLFAAGRVSAGRAADRWMRGGIGVPLGRGAQLLLDETRSTNDSAENRTHAASLHLPFGRLQIHQRFQAADTAFLNGAALDLNYRQAQSTASFALSRRMYLGYQSGTQWLQGGDVRQFREMQATILLTARTSLRLTSNLPDVLDARQLTVRLNHDVSKAWNLNAEYGRVSTYQPVSRLDADARRLALLVTRRFDIRTPAGGGTVAGSVVDESGRPVRGAPVRLGPYTMLTDPSGGYRFEHVPRGLHKLLLDGDRMPAGYAPEAAPVPILSVREGRVTAPVLRAVALQAIRGRVFVDQNANGRYDVSEGFEGAVLFVGDRVTTSTAGGEFVVHHVLPGTYQVVLDTSRLRNTVVPESPTSVAVSTGAGNGVRTVEFRLTPRSIPVRFQVWPQP